MQGYERTHTGITRPSSIIVSSPTASFHEVATSSDHQTGSGSGSGSGADPLAWSNHQILTWLINCGVNQGILDAFKNHNITGIVLPYLNSNELLEMGITNLQQRLEIKKLITNLLSSSTATSGTSGTLMDKSSELQALMISNELIQSVSKQLTHSINLSNQNTSVKRLTDQFNKLREDLLPIVKELKDKKPLPLPTDSPTRLSHHQSQLQSSIQPQKVIKNLSHSTSINSLTSRKSATSSIDSPNNLLSYNGNSPSLAEGVDFPSRKSMMNNSTSASNLNSLISSSSTLTLPTTITPSSDIQKSPVRPTLDPTKKSFARSTSSNNLQNRSSSSIPTLNKLNNPSGSNQSSTLNTPTASNEPLKQLRAKTDDPCYKTLQAAMKRHNLSPSDWKKFALVICYGGDQERVLGYEEKPVLVFRELSELGLNPSIMLRQIEDVDEDSLHYQNSHSYYEDVQTPGGRL